MAGIISIYFQHDREGWKIQMVEGNLNSQDPILIIISLIVVIQDEVILVCFLCKINQVIHQAAFLSSQINGKTCRLFVQQPAVILRPGSCFNSWFSWFVVYVWVKFNFLFEITLTWTNLLQLYVENFQGSSEQCYCLLP